VKLSTAASAFLSAVIDLVLVVVFVLIGRASHREDLAGSLNTLWPFAGGLAAGWVIARAWRSPRAIAWTGITVWVSTVAVGMLLRAATGQGVELAFIIVTTIVLAAFLLGWRALARIFRRRMSRA
jgi:peptidoglycan/LPS O-acetylase OafA/YrhL